jgi:hypothetical protein
MVEQILSHGLITSYENKQISFVNKYSLAVKLRDMKKMYYSPVKLQHH